MDLLLKEITIRDITAYLFVNIPGSSLSKYVYRGADKSLARPGNKQATATEDFEFRISYL